MASDSKPFVERAARAVAKAARSSEIAKVRYTTCKMRERVASGEVSGMLFNRPAFSSGNSVGGPYRAIARRDPIRARTAFDRLPLSIVGNKKAPRICVTHWRRPSSTLVKPLAIHSRLGSQVMRLPDHPNHSLYLYLPSDKHERPY